MTLIEIKNFLAMGGYGLYIWLAYGSVFLVLLLNLVIPYRKYFYCLQQVSYVVRKKDEPHS